jgi:hypothetical protein
MNEFLMLAGRWGGFHGGNILTIATKHCNTKITEAQLSYKPVK